MPRTREIAQVIRPTDVLEGAGVKLRRSFPSIAADYLDPFLLLDDFSSPNPEDYRKGFPWHPHRGIETVTYLLSGQIRHRDSLGNAGTIGPGEVQWMTAGSGIMHEEMPVFGPDPLIGFQLWVNLPADQKMRPPRYQTISADQIPVVPVAEGSGVRVIAGTFADVTGPAEGITIAPTYLDVRLSAGEEFGITIAPEANVLLYIFEGALHVGAEAQKHDDTVAAPTLVQLKEGDELLTRSAANGARYLLMAGRPIREPVARYGPFVMNTREEIEEALRDLRAGRFVRQAPEARHESQ